MLILLETMAEERRTATAPELLEPLMARLAGGDQEALAELSYILTSKHKVTEI